MIKARRKAERDMSMKGSEMNKARRKAERDMRVKGSEY